VLHLLKNYDASVAAYDAALNADPTRVEVLRWKGEALLAQGKYADAVAAFDDYLKKGGTSSVALYRQRGLAHVKLDQHREAIDDYNYALEAKPEDEEKAALYLYRGQEYLVANELQLALRDFKESFRINPKNTDASLGSAYVWLKLGEPRKAVTDAESVAQAGPKEPRLWLGAARVYAQAPALLKAEPGQDAGLVRQQKEYLDRAVELLEAALDRVPPEQQAAYWREQVLNDSALQTIRSTPGYARLADRYRGAR
jgi:tetratricopeptide (TPR) repeat protein